MKFQFADKKTIRLRAAFISAATFALPILFSQAAFAPAWAAGDSANPNSFVLSNPILKRRLEANHKISYVDLTPELSYLYLPLQVRGVDLIFLFGIFRPAKAAGQADPSGGTKEVAKKDDAEAKLLAKLAAKTSTKSDARAEQKKEDKKPGLFHHKLSPEESEIKYTRQSAENLIMGSARENLPVVDEFNAPPGLKGQLGPVRKVSTADALLTEAYDLICETKYEEAEARCKKALAEAPNSIRGKNNLACLMAINGRYQDAENIFNSLIPKTAPNGPRCSVPSINLANLYCLAGNNAEATKTLYGLEDSPEAKALPLRLALIRVLMQQGTMDKAKELLDEARVQFPQNLTLMELAGDVAIDEKDYKKAIDLLIPVSGKVAVDAVALLKVADAYNRLGDLDTAIKKATLATNNFPDDAAAHIALGKYYLANKEFLGAKLQFERTMELSPPFNVKLTSFVPYLKTLDAMNNFKGMQEVSLQWVKANPRQSVCHFNRGWALETFIKASKDAKEKEKLTQEAITEYERAIDLEPTNASATYNLAIMLYQAKRSDEAIKRLSVFLENSSNEADRKDAADLRKQLIEKSK